MAYSLPLPKKLRSVWKVKIRDKERLEEPHVSIMRKGAVYRYSLRRQVFLDTNPDPGGVTREVLDFIEQQANWDALIDHWDAMYPSNPVVVQKDSADDN